MRVEFDTTVLWSAFHNPAGPSFSLMAIAAQRTPVLDGFITDVIGAEFWWRATQQGVKGTGQRVARTYTEQELKPFLETFEVLLEPANMARAPLSRSLGQNASLVGLSLGEFLHVVTGTDRAALLAAATLSFPVTFESMDIADLHVICGALQNSADVICSSDSRLLRYDPIGDVRVLPPMHLAGELGLIDAISTVPRMRKGTRPASARPSTDR
jgi:predicted nucleic acid-binding protein